MTGAIFWVSLVTKGARMVGGLLLRGLLAGIIAGLFAAGFLSFAGEPSIERAIAYESAANSVSGHMAEPELVSRSVQRGAGLWIASTVYGAAIGGLFSLAFAFAYGRLGSHDPRILSVLLACAGFVAMVLVPELKYPSNPPAIGAPETIAARTAALFRNARHFRARDDFFRDAAQTACGPPRLLERRARVCCGLCRDRRCGGGGSAVRR